MARVGIDFGTTNMVVALADRGNYPVLDLARGSDARLSLPALIAWQGRDVRVGWEALEVWEDPAFEVLSSPKRLLGLMDAGAGLPEIDELVLALLGELERAVRRCPHISRGEPLEAMVGMPANANSLQRYRTLDLMARAGFQVLGLVHEPTAAALEYAHRHPAFGKNRGRGAPRHVVVYDLGGGTFDASVVRAEEDGFQVVASAGVEHLGGDDFDDEMARLALAKSGGSWDAMSRSAQHRLRLRCRELKESLRPTSRKWFVDLGDDAAPVPIFAGEYYDACLPLVDRTLEVLDRVLAASEVELQDVDALLLVGGGSQMPLVRRRLKDRMGTRVRVSPHPFASTAIGLAVHAARHVEEPVRDRFSHCFGVWREADDGSRRIFDPIFEPATLMPELGEKLTVSRSYQPVHNIGHFRYEECSAVDDAQPVGDRTRWCDIYFPFDPEVPPNVAMSDDRVRREGPYPFAVRELYECDAHGIITVRIERENPPLSRQYLLFGPERVPPIAART